MKKTLIVLVALFAMVAFVSVALAQAPAKTEKPAAPAAPAPEKAKAEKPKAPKAMKASGTVAAYDAAAKTLKIKAKDKDMDFAIADGAKIKGEVKEGAKVTVSYKKDGDKMIASAINVAAAKKPKAEKKEVKPEKK